MPDLNVDIDKPMAECPLSHVILDLGQIISTDRLIHFRSINHHAIGLVSNS